jgi:hypothetical protein
MRCPSCQVDNPPGNRFCGQCGAALPPRCRQCGAEIASGFRFCPQCGASLAMPPAGPTTSGPGQPAAEPARLAAPPRGSGGAPPRDLYAEAPRR